MFARFAGLLLAGSFVAAAPTALLAQTAQAPLQDRWPAPTEQLETRTPDVTPAPAPEPAPTPAPQATPAQRTQAPAPAAPKADDGATPKAAPAAAHAKPTPTPKPKQRASRKPAGPPTVVACSGVFAPDSSHQALESTFKEQNVTFTEIEGGQGGTKLLGSVLYPNDPKRRLEVFWQDESQRANVRLIAINGRSGWRGPKGLHLGLTIAAVQKINGKPFTLSAIDQDGATTVTDWQEGALASLPGGCNVGMRFAIDPKASEQARSAASAEGFTSTDKALRAVKPKTAEILIGYPPAR
jgi:hypothetical protein